MVTKISQNQKNDKKAKAGARFWRSWSHLGCQRSPRASQRSPEVLPTSFFTLFVPILVDFSKFSRILPCIFSIVLPLSADSCRCLAFNHHASFRWFLRCRRSPRVYNRPWNRHFRQRTALKGRVFLGPNGIIDSKFKDSTSKVQNWTLKMIF